MTKPFKVGDRVELNELGEKEKSGLGERAGIVLEVCGKQLNNLDIDVPIYYITDGEFGMHGTWHRYLRKVEEVDDDI